MTRALFVSNGHGEAAIADRIAMELQAMLPGATLDHLPLVGATVSEVMREVGPRRAMPSGGLIAMGNVSNLLKDVGAGLLPLVAAQRRFLRSARGTYDVAVAVGDAYALAMTLNARSRAIFVGTAKSVTVAPYGPFERRLIARARSRFVRDEATAQALRESGLTVEMPANVIVDLFTTPGGPAAAPAVDGFTPALALFPGSRAGAYEDAAFLLQIVGEMAASQPTFGAVLSIARGLEPSRFGADAARAGWVLQRSPNDCIPFVLTRDGREVVRAWTGSLSSLLERVDLVLGQAGTANEGAAAAGVPVVAFSRERDGKSRWYRRRQQGLLGDALLVLGDDPRDAVAGVAAILNDPARRRAMGATGRARMGPGGGARRIAERIVSLAEEQ